jgi:ABC-type lipoprotein export system ATPase subunit
MKVKELYIKKYHQFEDFHLNLTYPEGHKKAGQPLDKVCFIGQSGTGKTSLLGILKFFIENNQLECLGKKVLQNLEDGTWIDFNFTQILTDSKVVETFKPRSEIIGQTLSINYLYEKDNKIEEAFYFWNGNLKKAQNIREFLEALDLTEILIQYFDEMKKGFLFYFPCDIILPKSGRSIEPLIKNDNLSNGKIIDFENYDINQIWKTINEAIIEDRELEIKRSLEISKILRNPKVSKSELDKATDEFRKWREDTPNPIQDLADNYLDKIIGRFNLKVKTELDFEKTEDIETIKIQQKNGKEIPFEALSTGTKQVILTALPLYSLKPKDSIILFDEPERSLYPDIQAEIVKFYTDMAPECQFFFATHSPLVASSFEPWEIVELKFNEQTGNVYQELYYDSEKERHVDNYTIDPRYLRWDGILKKVFDLEKEGNDMRVSELVNLATLESQLKNNNLSIEQKKEKFEEYKKLANLLNWDLN